KGESGMETWPVVGHIGGLAEGADEGPVQVQDSRGLSRDCYFLDQGQGNSRAAHSFNFSSKQSNGPRAYRSGGHEEGQIDAGLADATGDFADRRHEAFGTAH